MAIAIKMPKMSDTMEEGVIASWLVKVGDTVESGDILAEVETDKATMELENYEDGTILYIGPKEKDSVPVDGIIAIIGEEGEEYESLLSEGGNQDAKQKPDAGDKEEKSAADREPGEPGTVPSDPVDTSSINATVVRMPLMSDTMEEGVIASWLVKEGDTVESGDILAEVETDKATMELENYEDGTILYLGAKEGEGVKVDGILAIIGEPGADYEALLKGNASGKSGSQAPTAPAEKPDVKPEQTDFAVPSHVGTEEASPADEGRIKASPLAKKMAKDKGINLSEIKGTGDNGRIVRKDIENFSPSAQPTPAAAPADKAQPGDSPAAQVPAFAASGVEESFEEIKVTQMRKAIARRLGESKFQAPHFYLTMEIDMDRAIAARASMNEVAPIKLSFNDMVVKAAAAALKKNPAVNSSWHGDTIRINHHIHMGVAVAVAEGLLVPVLKFADQKSLSQLSVETKELAGKAKAKKLQPAEMEGSTFTISNLGMFGIEQFTAIINPPGACILAVGGIKQTPVVKNGEIKVGNIMKVTLSCDHRVVDGAVGSAFLKDFKGLMEDPVRILV